MIKTRNLVQIRSHAQKYFQKLLQAKNSGLIGEGDYQLLMDGKRMTTGFGGAPSKVRMCAKVAPSSIGRERPSCLESAAHIFLP